MCVRLRASNDFIIHWSAVQKKCLSSRLKLATICVQLRVCYYQLQPRPPCQVLYLWSSASVCLRQENPLISNQQLVMLTRWCNRASVLLTAHLLAQTLELVWIKPTGFSLRSRQRRRVGVEERVCNGEKEEERERAVPHLPSCAIWVHMYVCKTNLSTLYPRRNAVIYTHTHTSDIYTIWHDMLFSFHSAACTVRW